MKFNLRVLFRDLCHLVSAFHFLPRRLENLEDTQRGAKNVKSAFDFAAQDNIVHDF